MSSGHSTVGRVTTPAKIENLGDLIEVERGLRKIEDVRYVEVEDALVDTGATQLAMPLSLIGQLGLRQYTTRTARTPTGIHSFNVYGAVQLTIQGRDCRLDVAEVADTCPVIIGQVPLEMLDWIVDPVNQRLIGNPEHGGKHMMDMF